VEETLNLTKIITTASKEELAISATIPTPIAATIIITTAIGTIIGIVSHLHRARAKIVATKVVQATKTEIVNQTITEVSSSKTE
jgi:hypothetical protein